MSTSFDHLSIQPQSLGECIDALPTFDFPPAAETVNGNVLVVSSGQFALYATGFTGDTAPSLHPDVQAEVDRFNVGPKRAWFSLIADAVRAEYRGAVTAIEEAWTDMDSETRSQSLATANAGYEQSGAHANDLVTYLASEGIPVPRSN